MVVATTSIPASISSSYEFADFIKDLDPRHTVPKKTTTAYDIQSLYLKGKDILKDKLLSSPSNIVLTTGIWTNPGFSSSFLGITPNYVLEEKKCLEGAVSLLVTFPSPHTGTAIANLDCPFLSCNKAVLIWMLF